MKNENTNITIPESAKVPMFKNAELNKATESLMRLVLEDAKNSMEKGRILYEIESKKLLKDTEFATVEEYGKSLFNWSKGQISKMKNVFAKYGTAPLQLNGETLDFSPTQLSEMLTLDRETVDSLIESGEISPDMTTKEIRDVVAQHKETKTRPDKVFLWRKIQPLIDSDNEEYFERFGEYPEIPAVDIKATEKEMSTKVAAELTTDFVRLLFVTVVKSGDNTYMTAVNTYGHSVTYIRLEEVKPEKPTKAKGGKK